MNHCVISSVYLRVLSYSNVFTDFADPSDLSIVKIQKSLTLDPNLHVVWLKETQFPPPLSHLIIHIATHQRVSSTHTVGMYNIRVAYCIDHIIW